MVILTYHNKFYFILTEEVGLGRVRENVLQEKNSHERTSMIDLVLQEPHPMKSPCYLYIFELLGFLFY